MASLGSFGSIVFQVSKECLYLIDGLNRKSAARVEEHKVSGGKPRLEFMAPELDSIDFTVKFYSFFGIEPLTEIDRLRELCQAGQVERLILAGQNLGKYLIISVSDDWRKTNSQGKVILATAKVAFKEYI